MNRENEIRIIRGGKVCDGSGAEPELKDLLLRDGRVAGIEPPGAFDALPGVRTDAAGKLIAPGFIDAHAHGDRRKLKYPENRTKLLQGVTTEVDGNCGSSGSCVPGESGSLQWRDLSEYAEIINRLPENQRKGSRVKIYTDLFCVLLALHYLCTQTRVSYD